MRGLKGPGGKCKFEGNEEGEESIYAELGCYREIISS